MGYHGKVVTNINADQYCPQPGVLSEYVLQNAGPSRQFIDASNEEGRYKNGKFACRLDIHTNQKKNKAIIKMVEVVISNIGETKYILKARRDIVPFEQLQFDYGDKVAGALLEDGSLTDFGFSTKFLTRFDPGNVLSKFEAF